MIDVFNLAKKENTSIYYAGCQNNWQTWYKNPNTQTVTIFCLGGGGGGAAGFGGTSTKNGGSGGGSAAYTIASYPAYLLPDTLFISVGCGGSGGTLAGAGQDGQLSYVTITPNSRIAADCVCVSGTVGAKGGVGGSTVTGGVGGTMSTVANSTFLSISTYYTFVGQQGANAVSGGVGLSITALTNLFSSGAAGGGGAATTSNSGGTIWSNNSIFPNIIGGVSSGGQGNDGINFMTPFCGVGGSGGGGNSSTGNIAGRGGNGSFGCGGGGGGCAHETASTGSGGNGGNGLVIIVQN